MSHWLSVAEAEHVILASVRAPIAPQDSESVPLLAAVGRYLATPVRAGIDFPAWDNSAMDGFAVRAADVAAASPDQPVELSLIETIAAGQVPQQVIAAGQAARIFTGAILPAGADAIAIQETCTWSGDRLRVHQAPPAGEFIRRRGEFCRAGAEILSVGMGLGPAEVAAAAAAGTAEVVVYRRPVVALLSTGNELVPLGQPPGPGQLIDSNQVALRAFLDQVGAIALPLGIVPDDRPTLRAAMAGAIAQADVVLSTGGVSVGDYDYVEDLLGELGGEVIVRAVAIRPGKPLTVATFDSPRPCLYVGLPGNPASALVGCWRFVAPALAKRSGRPGPWSPATVMAHSRTALAGAGSREAYVWGRLERVGAGWEFSPAAGGHSSGNVMNLAGTTGLAIVPVGGAIAPGEPVAVLPWSGQWSG